MTEAVLPELLEVERKSPQRALLRLRLPENLLYFRGHFPAAGILPAVVQIDWAIHYAVELFGLDGTFRGMDGLKFRRVLQPLEEPVLELSHDAEKGTLEFSYSTATGRHSSGQLWLR
jgi:3-hydroxymyristoyl/3-hydroxydecanoyl-(acyl carrier protein) dehydratase